MWTLFWDMNSGGGQKEKWALIYIEAPEQEAISIFYSKFGHNPKRVSCTCCGKDYSISSSETLEQVSGWHRGCDYVYYKDGKEITRDEAREIGFKNISGEYIERPAEGKSNYNKYIPLSEYVKNKDIMVVYKEDIKPDERKRHVPNQGYVWVD